MTTLQASKRPILVGNWKMNGTGALAKEAIAKMHAGLKSFDKSVFAAICPPATLIGALAEHTDPEVMLLGAQDCVAEACGARTGDLNAELLSEAGARIVILGHSERRTIHGETDAMIRNKVASAWANGLTALVCVGESLDDRNSDRVGQVIEEQLDGSIPDMPPEAKTIIAYEPVWAIGTGLVPTPRMLSIVYDDIRRYLTGRFGPARSIPLLYGGSVSASNAAELMGKTSFDGLLVGKASLSADEFLGIAKACADARAATA